MLDMIKLLILVPVWITLMFIQDTGSLESWNLCSHCIKFHEATQMFMMVDYVREMIARSHGKFKHLFFLLGKTKRYECKKAWRNGDGQSYEHLFLHVRKRVERQKKRRKPWCHRLQLSLCCNWIHLDLTLILTVPLLCKNFTKLILFEEG